MKTTNKTKAGLLAALLAIFSLNTINAEIIFTEDFEDGAWTGFSSYPSANTSVLNSGDTIYGAPATGAPGTYIVAPGGSKLGKMWPLYWSPGNVTTSTFVMYNDYWATPETGWVPYLQGKQVKLSMDVYISSYDPMQASTDVNIFAKFFNSDYSYYYDWASVITSVKDTLLDTWVTREITVTVPNDVSIIQFGLEMTQQNYSSGAVNVDNIAIQIVPEPSAGALIVAGTGCLVALRRFRK